VQQRISSRFGKDPEEWNSDERGMIVIGLTGGIGMGKSTVAGLFRRAHWPVFDADAAVHALQAPGGAALPALQAAFPTAVSVDTYGRRRLDRAALRAAVLADPAALQTLEGIIHPLVRLAERRFLAAARRRGAHAAVLDIPLLIETGKAERVDIILVVSAPRDVQINRVRRRRRMNDEQIATIIARQIPDREKRRRADCVVLTGLSRHYALRAVRRFMLGLFECHARSYSIPKRRGLTRWPATG
jgi:dephospho-CoA kinase